MHFFVISYQFIVVNVRIYYNLTKINKIDNTMRNVKNAFWIKNESCLIYYNGNCRCRKLNMFFLISAKTGKSFFSDELCFCS